VGKENFENEKADDAKPVGDDDVGAQPVRVFVRSRVCLSERAERAHAVKKDTKK
jgi:hypothetical protein